MKNEKLSPAMLEALRGSQAGELFAPRENGTFVRRSTVDALINRDLIGARFPHFITDDGEALINSIDEQGNDHV